MMSEHLINNKRFPLELHIEYRISDKKSTNKLQDPYMIIVFLFDFTSDDIDNQFLEQLPLTSLPKEDHYIVLDKELDLNGLFDTSFYKK